VWWSIPIIPTLGKLRQEGCEFEASLGYIAARQKTKKEEKRKRKIHIH
jgi:hypothetical protein